MRGRRVFVSGGAGVIGDALVRRLHEAGATVLVGDLQPRPRHWPREILYRQGDLNFATAEELAHFAPEWCFHLAATFERCEETPEFWEENARHNVELSHHLFTCLRDVPSLRRVVFASSYLIYDPARYTGPAPRERAVRLAEDAPVAARNLCGSAKLHAEVELAWLARRSQGALSAVSARIFRSYGRGSRDVVSRWVRSALAGETLALYAPEGRFDYVSAEDVAEGLLRLAASDATGVVNLGTGRSRRVAELLETLRGHVPGLDVREVEADVPYEAAEADTARLEAVTGWRPRRILEQMVPDLLAYERERAAEAAAPAPRRGVLVTSLSRKVPLVQAVRRAMARRGPGGELHGADADPDALAAAFVDRFWACPPLPTLTLEELAAYCAKHGIGAIVPTRDGELPWLARQREALAEAGVAVMVSPPQTVDDCLDKLVFARRLAAAGLPVVPTATRPEELRAERLVVKERFGSGSRGVHLDVSPAEARKRAAWLREPVFQPFVPGPELSIDLYVEASGAVKGVVCRSRDRVVDGESQVSTVRHLPGLEELCACAARTLGLRGHAVMQALHGPDGFALVECNPRFGGASTLAVAAGLDSFTWFLLEAEGAGLAGHPFLPARQGLRLVRHAADRIAP